MTRLFKRKCPKTHSAGLARQRHSNNADPFALEALEPRLLLAADLGAGLDVSTAWDRDEPLVAAVLDELPIDGRFADGQSELSPLAGAIRQSIGNETAEPLNLTELGGLFGTAPTTDPTDSSPVIRNNATAIIADRDRESVTARTELVFIDAGVEDYQQLLADLELQTTADRQIEVHLLDARHDGVEQINSLLGGYRDLDAVHILSHGSAGEIRLGDGVLNTDTLAAYSDTLSVWGQALSADADFLIYGCDLAGTAEGQALVDALAGLSGADVAASTDRTGHVSQDGDWDLEYQFGVIESATPFSAALQQGWNGVLATITVDTSNDLSDAPDTTSIAALFGNKGADGKISLREAIKAANADPNGSTPDEIHFQITDALVGGAHTITVGAGGLPAISEAVVIDGTTDLDYSGAPIIELNGASAGTAGLSITGDGVTIRGLVINRFSGHGIEITGDNNRIELSYIGTDVSGTADLGNNQLGIRIANAVGNYIGGSGVGNVVSGNSFAGIAIVGSTSSNNFIQGNLIGTNAAGAAPIGNNHYGIDIWSGGPANNTIGGTTTDLRNVISGNGWAGIHISGSTATGNVVLGNYIGTDISGTLGIGNGSGGGSNGGIDIDGGADNNTIGGTADGSGNRIAFNTGPGVRVDGVTTVDNAILENEIHSNTDIGIIHNSGGNQARSDPNLSSVLTNGVGSVTITGTYSDASLGADTPVIIDFFSNSGNDREGRTYLGSDALTTDGSGNAVINSSISATVAADEYVSATVTDSLGNTSEFSVGEVAVASLIAGDDFATTSEDTAVVIDVDDNDSGGFTILDHTLATNGTVADNGDGTFTYTPDPNFNGTDSFDYLVSDGSDSLSHYWRLDGDATDQEGSNNGTLFGSPTTVSGHYGAGMHFNGATDSDYISIPDFNYAADATVSFRFKVDDNSGTLFQYFYSHGNAGTANSLNVYLGETGNGIYPDNIVTYIRDNNDTADAGALNVDIGSGGLNLIGDGQWHSYTLTIENGVGSKVYIDGALQSSAGRGADALDPAAPLILGAPSTFSSGRYYGGDLDSLQIIDQVLNAPDVAALHAGTTSAQDSATATITVDPVNDAPTISTAIYNLGSTNEDTTSTGVRVSTIVGGLAAGDPDGDTPKMAVIGASGNGSWEYSTDSTDGTDGTWTGFGSVSTSSALLLSDTTWVRYVPDGENGENVGLTFHAWDGTSGSASTSGTPSTADPAGGGGTTAFSANTAQADLSVTPLNDAPVIGAIGDQSVDEGATLNFTATATDVDLPADTLSFSLDAASLALGMSIDANTGAFSWTPTEGQGGLAPSVTVTVTDDGTGTLFDSETFTITVNDLNTAPVLGAIGDQSIDELATLSFTATATDSDLPADTLTFSLDAASLALGMTIDANTGAFSWTPTEGQGGLTPSVTVTVTDDGTGNLFDSETFTVTVNDLNTAPVLGAVGDQSIDELATLTFTATATDSDLPADTLSFSLDAASLALGMTIDANTGAFSWTPTEGQGGLTPSVTVTVTDDGTGTLFDSETFTITVNDTNTAPVLSAVGDQSVAELATLTFTATATDSDLPADALTFSLDAASIALGMSIDANTGAFSWTPTEAQGGLTPSVTVTVTDSGSGNLVDSETFTITVNDTNTAPVLGAIGNQSIDEGATLSFTATATDADLPVDTLTFSLDAASIALGMSIDPNSGAFSWTPTEAQGGLTPSVTVTVTDDGTGTLFDSETFTITVNDLNTAPVLGAIGNQSIDEGATLSFTATATDADLPADTLTFSLDAASIALGMSIDANTGAFSWTPTEGQGGTTPSVTVTVTDSGSGNLVDGETFTITVNDTNTAPVLGAIGNQSVNEGSTLSFTATATDADLPADTLTFSLDAASIALGMSIDANTGAFSWTPTEGQGGTTPSVTVTVTDDGTGNLVDSETFTITVNDLNVAPVLGAIGDQSVDELATLTFTVTATDADLPADTLSFSLDAASIALGMTIDANTGAFSWTPTEGQGGLTPSVTVTVTDDGTGTLFDSETFTITVNDLNTAPVLGAIGDQSVDELATLTFTATATDSDLPADTLTFSLDAASLALGMTIDPNTGAFSWTPTEGQGGLTPSVTVTVTDDGTGTLFDSETFTITVNDLNTAPVLGAIGNQTVDEGATLSFTATATDSDLPADNLTFTLDAASIALGMTIDPNTGAFSWTPTEGQGGTAPSVTITVTDDGTGTLFDSETFTITVNDLNTAPVLGAIGNQSIDEGVTLSFTATATDADLPVDNLNYSLDAASIALGMTIDANSGDFSWTPTEAQGGTTPSVTITVTDDGTGTLFDSETFTVSVNDLNTAPVLGAIGDQSIDELSTLSFTATATDADLPADNLAYSLDAASIALGMSIDSTTGAFSWTPTEGQGGLTPSVTVTVTDDGAGTLFDSETFTITVNDLNTAPVLGAIGDQSVDEGATLSFTATATDSDLPADTLSFSLDAASIALGMSIDANTGAFSWTPTEAQGGLTPSVTVTVTDDGTGNLVDSETFTITVNDTNTAPVLGAIGNQTVDEGATLTFTATATDSDLPADNLTLTLDAASLALGMTIDANTGAFSWTPTEGQGGLTPSVTVTVTDDGTGTLFDSETFTITVNDTNTAPVLSAVGDQSVAELTTLTFTATATDSDLPADTLTFSLDAASLALGMTIDANTGAFSWTPTEGQGGLTPSVTVTVTDDGTGSLVDSETFTITVNDTNTAPVLGAIGNQSVGEGSTLSFTATATDADLPADTLTFSLDAASIALGMSIDANSGAFSWTPTEAQGGITPSVFVTVTDDGTGNLIDNETFTITVNDLNTAPVLGAIGNQTVDELATLTFTATATDSDLPADNLSYSLDAASLALGMTIDANTGVFSWTPAGGMGGMTPSVTITVTDDGTGSLFESETFTITVNTLNTAPVLGAIGNQSIDELATLSFTATATDADLPANTLTFSLDAASIALGMSIDPNTGAFSWTPTEGQGGLTPSVTVTVTDDGTGTLFDSETFTITVNDLNVAPVITSDGAGATAAVNAAENQTAVTTVMADDSDLPTDTLTYTVSGGADAGLFSIDPNSGVLSFVSARDYEAATDANLDGIYEVEVQVSDGTDTDTQLISVTVTDANDAPKVTLSGPVTNLAENTDTSTRIKVADILVTDDGVGSNALSLSGADAVLFEIDGTELFLKAGTVVDFEIQNAYTVAIRVDDTTVGATPDDEAVLLVGVLDVNDSPVLDGIETQAETYNAGDAPVAVSLMVTVDDQDDTQIEWAVIKFTGNYRAGEDILHFADTASITGTWDAASGTLTLVGVDTVGAYQAALRTVTYENLSSTPDTATRDITLTVNDGDAFSNAVSRNIDVAEGTIAAAVPAPVFEMPHSDAPTVDPAPSRTQEVAVREATEPDHAVEHRGSDEASATDSDEEPSEPVSTSNGSELEADAPVGDEAPVSDGDGAAPTAAKPSVADLLAQDVAAVIQKNAGLLEKLAIAPKQAVLGSIAAAVSIQELKAQLSASDFTRELDDIREDLVRQATLEQVAAGTALASSTSLAVGYVMWLFRGGALLSGFLSSMAAWQLADPLPILAHSLAAGKRGRRDDEDSLESLVEEGSKAAREKRGVEDGRA